jgi:hypothetical protein
MVCGQLALQCTHEMQHTGSELINECAEPLYKLKDGKWGCY